MTNKLVVIINSLKVTKIKKILLYEMKFIVPNYSCLQNPWLGGYRLSLSSVINWICWTPRTKFLGTPLLTTKVASYHHCGAWGFKVLLNFWKTCTTLLNVKSKIVLAHAMAA